MKKNLSKSPETLEKEARIEALRQELKQRKTTLKSLTTRLQNTKDEIERIQRKVQVELFGKLDQLQELRLEVIEWAQKLEKVQHISPEDRKALGAMIDDLVNGDMFGEMFQEYQDRKEQEDNFIENEEDQRARLQDLFAQFQVEPEETEQRDIRRIFLGLSKVFHPDRAKDEEETAYFHQMQLKINEAYKNHDVKTLLELDKAYLQDEIDLNVEETNIDNLQLEIDRLERELAFINNQIQRTSGEIKNLRESELGTMKSNFKQAERYGGDFEEMTGGFAEMIDVFSRIRDGLKDSVEKGMISPILIEMMLEQEDEQAALEEFLDMMGIDMGDLFDEEEDEDLFFMGDHDGDDLEEVENPKFPIDSSVRIAKSVRSPFLKKTDMKGWEGRVIDVYKETGEVIYELEFDSITMKQMPKALIKKALTDAEDFQSCAVSEQLLEASEPRDTERQNQATYRTLFHQSFWDHCGKTQQNRLIKILLNHPAKSDEQNWEIHLRNNLHFPFKAKTRDLLGSEEGIPLQVLGQELYDESYGIIVNVKLTETGEIQAYPLVGLKGAKPGTKISHLLDDYYEWGLDFLGGVL